MALEFKPPLTTVEAPTGHTSEEIGGSSLIKSRITDLKWERQHHKGNVLAATVNQACKCSFCGHTSPSSWYGRNGN